jgi:hypothetical protein
MQRTHAKQTSVGATKEIPPSGSALSRSKRSRNYFCVIPAHAGIQ